MIRTTLAAVVAAVATCLLLAAPAHADDQSYIDALRAAGVPVYDDHSAINGGHSLCGSIRAHGGNVDVARFLTLGLPNNVQYGQQIADAAQHELCPDTLP